MNKLDKLLHFLEAIILLAAIVINLSEAASMIHDVFVAIVLAYHQGMYNAYKKEHGRYSRANKKN